jgi:hypothetical protein
MGVKWKRIVQYVNKNYSVKDLLKKFYGLDVSVGYTFKCPFHNDKIKSAKLFPDNRFYCFAEGKQYSPYLIMRNAGFSFSDLSKEVPEDFEYDKEDIAIDDNFYKMIAFSFRDEFKKTGDIKKLIVNWNSAIDYHEGIKNG